MINMATETDNLGSFINMYEDTLDENDFQSLKFYNVTKEYKNIVALNKISLTLKRGDIFGYIGPNGAGKTTTIKIIVGLIKNYAGEYLINDKIIIKKTNNLFNILGYHPQDTGFQTWRTVNHALYTLGRLSGINKATLNERIQAILKFVGLQEFRDKKIKHLSSGMIQKLRLAQALLNLPKLLILDEPLSGLDPASRFQIKSLIKNLAQKGITILFSSHILNDVEDIASKIGILNQGHIMKIGTPTELQDEFQLGNIIEIIYAENSNHYVELESIKEIERIEKISNIKQLIYLHRDINLDEVTHKILGFIIQQKCRIRSFKFLKPSLENVYLNYLRGGIK